MEITYSHKTLKAADSTLNSILDIINEGTWDWNALTGHVERSSGWYRMLGYDVGVFANDVFTWENIIHPDDYSIVMKHFELYTTGKIDKYEIEYRCKKQDETYLWIFDRAKVVEYGVDGEIVRMIGAHQSIHERRVAQSELIKKNQFLNEGNATLTKLLEEKNRELEDKNRELEKKVSEIEYLSITDSLTGISNRRMFESMLDKEISRAKRYKHALSIVIIDIDYFKKVNDKFGHKVGDTILQKLSTFIKNRLRGNDCFSRWGGEEFAVILPETNLRQSIEVCQTLRECINQIEFEDDLFISCSFGTTEYILEEPAESLFLRADKALYRAKELGRNRVESIEID